MDNIFWRASGFWGFRSRGFLIAGEVYALALRQTRERFGETHPLVLYQELKDVPPRTAPEAFVDAHARVHVERRRFLVMEWTKSLVIRPRFLEAHELADDVFYRSAVSYLIDHIVRYSSHSTILIPKSQSISAEPTPRS